MKNDQAFSGKGVGISVRKKEKVKKLLRVIQVTLFVFFVFSLCLTIYQLLRAANPVSIEEAVPEYSLKEEFDPSLLRISSMDELAGYCDSLYEAYAASVTGGVKYQEVYPEIVSQTVRKRFYHTYSFYNSGNNYLGAFLSFVTIRGLGAVVVPDDIMKYPYAACSQQSIVMMELLGKKEFLTRKVGMKGRITGHFCFEVYYNGGWHFFDPDMEPDASVLKAYGQPDMAYLATHTDVLLKAYHNHPPALVRDIFSNYFYGKVNAFPAPRAILFQKVTKFLSYTIWAFFLFGFIWSGRKYKKLQGVPADIKEVFMPATAKGGELYYPGWESVGTI